MVREELAVERLADGCLGVVPLRDACPEPLHPQAKYGEVEVDVHLHDALHGRPGDVGRREDGVSRLPLGELQVVRVRLVLVEVVRFHRPKEGVAEDFPVPGKDAAPREEADVLVHGPLEECEAPEVGVLPRAPHDAVGVARPQKQVVVDGAVSLPLHPLGMGAEGPDGPVDHGREDVAEVGEARLKGDGEGIVIVLDLVQGTDVKAVGALRSEGGLVRRSVAAGVLLFLADRVGLPLMRWTGAASALQLLPLPLLVVPPDLLSRDEYAPPPDHGLGPQRLKGQGLVPSLGDDDRVPDAGEPGCRPVLLVESLQRFAARVEKGADVVLDAHVERRGVGRRCRPSPGFPPRIALRLPFAVFGVCEVFAAPSIHMGRNRNVLREARSRKVRSEPGGALRGPRRVGVILGHEAPLRLRGGAARGVIQQQ
mmetsp:Transcript_17502/g.51042  ORF Transcript_17502/g.51042 Transcript_17502/m.51042 type:complete len:425 (+) Transcript_17502:3620-4894(+)